MKKLLIILSLSAALLTSCGKEATNNNTQPKPNETETTTQTETTGTKTPVNEAVADTEDTVESDENKDYDKNLGKKEIDSKEDKDEKIDEKEMSIAQLYDDSDYVAILRMTQTGADGYEVNINEDFKGSLNNIVMPKINGIEPNKDYLVFMKDSPEGEIVATTPDSLYAIDGRDDKNVAATREIHESRMKIDTKDEVAKPKEKNKK